MGGSEVRRAVVLRSVAPPAVVLSAGKAFRQVWPADGDPVTLFEDRIAVRDSLGESEALPRRYTLTRGDRTAEHFLSIGPEFDQEAASRPRNRDRREVLAELTEGPAPRLHVTCLISGEALAGRRVSAAARRRIFEAELPLALAVIRYGDRFFYERHRELDQARVTVEFRSSDPRFGGEEEWGRITDYRVTRIAGESRRLAVGAAALVILGLGALLAAWRRRGGG